MTLFLDALCDENITSLIISGTAKSEELNEAWLLILSEYYELRGDTLENVEQWTLSRDILVLQHHLQLVDKCVQFLARIYSEAMAQALRDLGYSFRPTSKTPIDYASQLERVVNKSKTKYILLQQFIKQLEKLMLNAGKEKPKRDYFEAMVIHIEEMQKVTYDIDHLTVSKYLLLEKKYIQKCEQLKQLHAKQ